MTNNVEQNNNPANKESSYSLDARFSNIFDTIRLFIWAFSIIIALIIGISTIFGIRTLRNLDESISTIIDRRLYKIISNESGETDSLSEKVGDMKSQMRDIEKEINILTDNLKNSVSIYNLDIKGTDAIGRYLKLSNSPIDPRNLQHRREARFIFEKLLEESKEKNISAQILYNASATASKFQMFFLGAQLSKAAYKINETPIYEARFMRYQLVSGAINSDDAFSNILNIIQGIATDKRQIMDSHLSLSEGVNVALLTGRILEFIDALQHLRKHLDGEATSYMCILEAELRIRRGLPSDVDEAAKLIPTCLPLLESESSVAEWRSVSIKDATVVLEALEKNPKYQEEMSNLLKEFDTLLNPKYQEEMSNLLKEFDTLLNTDIPLDTVDTNSELDDFLSQFLETNLPTPNYNDKLQTIYVDQEISADIENEWIWYELSDVVAGIYSISVIAEDPDNDSLLTVRSEGDLLGFDDDSGDGLNSYLEVELASGKQYVIGVGSMTDTAIENDAVKIIITRIYESNKE